MIERAKVYAITMWEFSWLERRWPGAGYEDWDLALSELIERGYDAVRIDAFPHLLDDSLEAEYELLPAWGVNDWGAYMRCRVRPYPALLEFLEACGRHGVKVGLSSWYRRDTRECWRRLFNPARHASAWKRVLDLIHEAGLMEHVLYLDFCNEWPMQIWAPFFHRTDDRSAAATIEGQPIRWYHEASLQWMQESCGIIRQAYPDLPLTYSFHPFQGPMEQAAFLDFFDAHLWMADGELYRRIGWTFKHKFDYSEYELVQRYAEKQYRLDESYWLAGLDGLITNAAAAAKKLSRPMVTTECWGIVDYKDGPGLDWGWVKEVCAHGTKQAAATGAWWAIATSNFCGPQFKGMWRDVEWHQQLTNAIKSGKIEL